MKRIYLPVILIVSLLGCKNQSEEPCYTTIIFDEGGCDLSECGVVVYVRNSFNETLGATSPNAGERTFEYILSPEDFEGDQLILSIDGGFCCGFTDRIEETITVNVCGETVYYLVDPDEPTSPNNPENPLTPTQEQETLSLLTGIPNFTINYLPGGERIWSIEHTSGIYYYEPVYDFSDRIIRFDHYLSSGRELDAKQLYSYDGSGRLSSSSFINVNDGLDILITETSYSYQGDFLGGNGKAIAFTNNLYLDQHITDTLVFEGGNLTDRITTIETDVGRTTTDYWHYIYDTQRNPYLYRSTQDWYKMGVDPSLPIAGFKRSPHASATNNNILDIFHNNSLYRSYRYDYNEEFPECYESGSDNECYGYSDILSSSASWSGFAGEWIAGSGLEEFPYNFRLILGTAKAESGNFKGSYGRIDPCLDGQFFNYEENNAYFEWYLNSTMDSIFLNYSHVEVCGLNTLYDELEKWGISQSGNSLRIEDGLNTPWRRR